MFFENIQPISCHVTSLLWNEPEEELNKLLLTQVYDRDRNVNVNIVGNFYTNEYV